MRFEQLQEFLTECIIKNVTLPSNPYMTVVMDDFYEVVPEDQQKIPDLEYNHAHDNISARVIIKPRE